jgi:tRNA(adenine34) deaminase
MPKRGSSLPDRHEPAPASDELWMEEALRAAQRGLEADEVPVGAIVVCDRRIVGWGWNRNIADFDPTAHAEIMALRQAGAEVGNHRLMDCEVFATIEPCARARWYMRGSSGSYTEPTILKRARFIP